MGLHTKTVSKYGNHANNRHKKNSSELFPELEALLKGD